MPKVALALIGDGASRCRQQADSRERKRIVRLLIDDVTLIKAQTITAHVRLSGGTTRTLVLDRPIPIAQIRKLKPELVATVDQLLDQHCDREIADILNREGWRAHIIAG